MTAVEANAKAFLKCLVVKELLGLDRCSFLCGDAVEYLSASDQHFDLCIACGILYHMVEPVRLIDLISRRARRVVMWTHFYDDQVLANKRLAKRLGPAQAMDYEGFRHQFIVIGIASTRALLASAGVLGLTATGSKERIY